MKSYYAGVSGLADILERKIQYLKYKKNKNNFFSPKTIKIKTYILVTIKIKKFSMKHHS